jgi:hypothetical protein
VERRSRPSPEHIARFDAVKAALAALKKGEEQK